jgi:hypothetical protein
MSGQSWVETKRLSFADGPALSNSSSITSLLNAQDKIVLGGCTFGLGRGFRLGVRGRASNIVTTPGTLTFTARYGTTAIGVSQAIQLNATAQTNVSFMLDLLFTCRAEGSAGNFMFQGWAESVAFGSGSTLQRVMIPASAPAVGGNADLSVNGFIDLMGTFSIANAGNSIQIHQYALEILN